MIDAEPPEGDGGGHRNERAREHLHAHEAFNLQVDVVENLHRDLLLRERAAADLDEFALVQIAGDEKEVDEKENEHELTRKSEEPNAARPEIIAGAERRLDHFDLLDSRQLFLSGGGFLFGGAGR